MKKIVYIILFIIMINFSNIKVDASSKIDLCVVYEKESYEKGDLVSLSFDLPKFSNLFEVIIRVNYDENVFKPIIYNNEYFKLNNHSIFEEFVVNKKINESTLYAELMKSDASDGYYSSYKNNLCILEFNTLSHIDNIKNYFNSSNIQVFLFDINHSLIDYEIKQIKLLDAGFKSDSYDVDVYSSGVLLEDIFYVNNRQNSEYVILEEKKVDFNTLGTQIFQIGVFDNLTGKYLTYSTIINVIDNVNPIIEGQDEYLVYDIEVDNLNFVDFITASDNYDKNLSILVNYYNKEYEKINSYSDAVNVIKNDLIIYVGYVAVDGSLNKSSEKLVKFSLVDTVSPIIDVSDINIIDKELASFEITEFIDIKDNLDKNPQVIMSFYNSDLEVIDNYKESLTINKCCYLDVYGIDSFSNISEKIRVKINLIDKTSPNILFDEVSYINDYELNDFDFNNLIVVNDNDQRKCDISYDFIIEGIKSGDVGEFRNNLVLGKECFIKYYVYDYSLNYSSVEVQVIIKDTIPPSIKVNIEHEGVYKSLDLINVEVVDNLSSNLVTIILLDGNNYNGEKIEEGQHVLYVEVCDESGNKISESYSFLVSSKSFVGNLLDGNVKLKSSIIALVVIASSVVIAVLKYRSSCKLKKNYKEN